MTVSPVTLRHRWKPITVGRKDQKNQDHILVPQQQGQPTGGRRTGLIRSPHNETRGDTEPTWSWARKAQTTLNSLSLGWWALSNNDLLLRDRKRDFFLRHRLKGRPMAEGGSDMRKTFWKTRLYPKYKVTPEEFED